HDPHKVYAAYAAAVKHKGQPTVILAKTVKGYGMGAVGEGKNVAHQQKKMPIEALRQFRDRFNIPIADDKLADIPYFKPADDAPETKYLRELRALRGGSLPQRRRKSARLEAPKLELFKPLLEATAPGREVSTTMAFVRLLTLLVRDKNVGKRVVPIVPDESRTFGMEGLFRQLGIYSSLGQLYEPEDSEQLMFYKEDRNGQILQEGINEAGAQCSWMAAATSYSNNNVPMIPFYIFYSMFGMQRVGDLVWASGDMRARGFLLGGTAGRTTLNGEGLQHEDGHSHVFSSVIPNCCSYDPTFSYEVAVIVQEGLRRMVEEQVDVFYYITLMNENYAHPGLAEEARAGILKGMYRLSEAGAGKGARVQLLGSGTILREVMAAAELLKKDWEVSADVWSCPSFTELRRDGIAAARWNLLHPTQKPRLSYVEECLARTQGPVIASTDYIRTFADQIREFVPRRYKVLGTDGFGRSDSRENLRRFFEVNRYYVTVAALKALAEEGDVPAAKVAEAIAKYRIDSEKPAPWTV
ncbi:MAG TPA: pyruvate dehydrogenase (acetyl-transferring), homodimeric type, partial [Usitatibacter sp.]|nr:pyruvate dehydrogenase (acetyl-transferring), homodimeric type [Usitatibacter sp.]